MPFLLGRLNGECAAMEEFVTELRVACLVDGRAVAGDIVLSAMPPARIPSASAAPGASSTAASPPLVIGAFAPVLTVFCLTDLLRTPNGPCLA